MEIIIDDHTKAENFTTIFQNVRCFTELVNISFTEEGLSFQTMDNSHVSIVELTIPKEWFSKYTCSQNVVLGVNVTILHKILAVKEKTHVLKIVYEASADTLEIHFLNVEGQPEKEPEKEVEPEKKGKKAKKEKVPKVVEMKTYEKHFEIPLVDMDMERMEIPTIEYEAEFSLESTNFSNIVSQLRMFGDTMEIQCSEEQIILYTHSNDAGKMSVEISVDDLTEFAINEGQQLKLSFSLIYLNHICGFNRLTKDIDIKICSDYPLCAIYKLSEGAVMRFFLAPKMEDE